MLSKDCAFSMTIISEIPVAVHIYMDTPTRRGTATQ